MANNKGCYSNPASITITIKDKHIWKGYADTTYGNDANWDFGYPKFNIGSVEIETATFQPILNKTGAFSVPSLVVKQNSSLEVNGFLNVGELNSYVKKANFSFSSSSTTSLVNSQLNGIYEISNAPNGHSLEFKKKFGLGKDYGLYSFRHTFISKLYNTFIKEMTPEEAESNIMSITGHTSKTALRKYLYTRGLF